MSEAASKSGGSETSASSDSPAARTSSRRTTRSIFAFRIAATSAGVGSQAVTSTRAPESISWYDSSATLWITLRLVMMASVEVTP